MIKIKTFKLVPMDEVKLPDPNCSILLDKNLPTYACMNSDTFEEMWNLHPKERGSGIIAGKLIEFPRWQQSYGRNYKFTGVDHEALPITSHLFFKKILKYLFFRFEIKYNQILVNWYDSGFDYIGYHSDDTRELEDDAPIVSFSYGETRDFYVRANKHSIMPKFGHDFVVEHNSMLAMTGDTQKFYKHSIVKRTSKSNPLGKRISITARKFV